MNLGRKKKRVQPPAEPEDPPITVFGEVVVPKMYETFTHEGFEIYTELRGSTIKNSCTSCGGDVEFSSRESWQEVISKKWICGDCVWYRDEYKSELRMTSKEIEELEGLQGKLIVALSELLSHKPASLDEDSLRQAGLILHHENSEAVLGFVLIDYSREQVHKLVTAVNGHLEPFSRGFKLFLPLEYYKLLPGSYHWGNDSGAMYLSYIDGSYLDCLSKRKSEIESRAERIQARIAVHMGATSGAVSS